MTAEAPESLVTEGVGSLEVRWIFPGQIETAVAEWFGRFPAETQLREDIYLVDPQLRRLSVKVRGGVALEVKVYRGSPGILDLPGRACGRMQSWQKWSFPFSPLGQDSGELAGWRPVRKRRRISQFSVAREPVPTQAPGLGHEPRCAVELTEVSTPAQDWWTLGFEAAGPMTGCTAYYRPPQLSYSLRPCPAARNPARRNPSPTRSGCASGRAPRVTRTPK